MKKIFYIYKIFALSVSLTAFFILSGCGIYSPNDNSAVGADTRLYGTWTDPLNETYTFNSDGTYKFISGPIPINGLYAVNTDYGTLKLTPNNELSQQPYYYSITPDDNTLTIYYIGMSGDPTNYTKQQL
jgi:hypothetical protein